MIKVTATVNTRALRELEESIQRGLEAVVAKAAFKVQQDAQAMAPVDTGALRASIFTVTFRTNGKAGAVAQMRALNGEAKEARFTDVPQDAFEAFVVVGVEYGIYQELGSRGRPGRFYVTQSGARNRDWFMNEAQRALRGNP